MLFEATPERAEPWACLADPDLVQEIAKRKLALTVCPLSNLRLKVVPSLERHPLKDLMDAGLHVTVNSDDPSYFDGYVSENLIECRRALDLSLDEIVRQLHGCLHFRGGAETFARLDRGLRDEIHCATVLKRRRSCVRTDGKA
nr:hypothetical protein [Bradyrhizobium sp. 1]